LEVPVSGVANAVALVAVLVTWSLGLIVIAISNFVFYAMVREVNAVSPKDRQVSFWMAGWKAWGVFQRHRELFPESTKRYKMGWLAAIGSILLAGALTGGILATNAGWIKN
jgi:hypothetical protein